MVIVKQALDSWSVAGYNHRRLASWFFPFRIYLPLKYNFI